jgi:hypothetical protein
MKKYLFIILITIILLDRNKVYAQWTYVAPNIYPTTLTDKLGLGITTPSYRLEVSGDDISIYTDTKGYRLGGSTLASNYVLWHNGDERDIYVGVGAHVSTFSFTFPIDPTVAYNTLAGYAAGNQLTGGCANTYIGAGAGANSTTAQKNVCVGYQAGFTQTTTNTTTYSNNEDNTFVGYEAGYYNNGPASYPIGQGSHNSFFGDRAGYKNSIGYENTYIGGHSGQDGTTGIQNTALGSSSGRYNTTGNRNSSVGYASGISTNGGDENSLFGYHAGLGNLTGSRNTLLGSEADVSVDNLENANAIGAKAIVNYSDQMILGGDYSIGSPAVHHSTYVGIGLSGTLNGGNGPQNSLEINAAADLARSPVNLGTGLYTASGLRLTQVRHDNNPNPEYSTTTNQNYDDVTIQSWGKVLTVDENGDVGLTDDLGGTNAVQNALSFNTLANRIEWGGNASTDALLHNTEVQMIDPNTGGEYNIYFSGMTTDKGWHEPSDIGIGYPFSTPLTAKLDVINITDDMTNGDRYNNLNAGKFYETGYYNHSPFPGPFVGVKGTCDVVQRASKLINIGGDFDARQADVNIGARGTADGESINMGLRGNANSGNIGIGVYSESSASTASTGYYSFAGGAATTNYGLFSYLVNGGIANIGVFSNVNTAFTPPANTDIAVYGVVNPINNAPGNIAIYGDLGPGPFTNPCPPGFPPGTCSAPDYAGYFIGDVLTTTAYWPSDANLKSNIEDLSDGLSIINQLQPKSYYYNMQSNASMHLPSGIHYGLLAQDLQSVLPNLVKESVHPARYDSAGENQLYPEIEFRAVNYIEIIPYLIAGMKQQQSQIEALQAIVNSHHSSPAQENSEEQTQGQTAVIDVTLSSKTIVLDQNQPNPFKEQTTISYFIPDGTKNVKIIFTDSKGNVMKEVEVKETGKGQLNVYAQDLSSGVYSYTLVADGVSIDSKKMVCSK